MLQRYVADRQRRVFPYVFMLSKLEDLGVEVDGAPGAIETVTGIGNAAGGTVVLQEPPRHGQTVILYRRIAVDLQCE